MTTHLLNQCQQDKFLGNIQPTHNELPIDRQIFTLIQNMDGDVQRNLSPDSPTSPSPSPLLSLLCHLLWGILPHSHSNHDFCETNRGLLGEKVGNCHPLEKVGVIHPYMVIRRNINIKDSHNKWWKPGFTNTYVFILPATARTKHQLDIEIKKNQNKCM